MLYAICYMEVMLTLEATYFFFSPKFAVKKNLLNKQTKLPLSFIEIAGLHEKQL